MLDDKYGPYAVKIIHGFQTMKDISNIWYRESYRF